ncbi:MAG: hypothetical protein QOC81_1671 [Thermoanaerobaculia bacterium]|jgi:hypothetical protein|nr:hypothetical protein [Thermoanaerobaculia bacterium]
MDRLDLVPAVHRRERLFLLDLLAGGEVDGDFRSLDAEGFLAVTPRPLYPFVYRRLAPIASRIGAPEAMLARFAAHYRQNAMMHLRRLADLRRIGEALDAAGIGYLVLKGPVLAATVYDDASTRTMLDVDLLVRDLAPAMTVLASLGYVIPERFAGALMNAGDAPPLWNGEQGAPIVELHALLDSAPDNPAALESAWSTARVVDLRHDVSVPTLGRGEFLAHVIMHVSRHHRFEGELRSLLDVALLMRSQETEGLDWIALAAEWEARGIAGWIALTLSLANVLLGSAVPEALRRFSPEPEALMLAAEQLWIQKETRVSGRVTSLFTREHPAPQHAHEAPVPVPAPAGITGAWLRARRPWQSMRNVIASLRSGALRPRNVAESVAMLRKRERLYAIVEKTSTGSPNGRPPR